MQLLQDKSLWVSGAAGLAYGGLLRLLVSTQAEGTSLMIMSCAFLLLVPFAIGFISVYFAERACRQSLRIWLGLPALNTLIIVVSSFLFFWEGIICLVMFLPIAALAGMLGGLTGGYCARHFGKTPLVCIALLPFVTAPLEQRLGPRWEIRDVHTAIDIQASPEVVWDHIKRVALIQPHEQQFSWTQAIGFPRPLEATLSHEGVGAIRHATFAGGVLFIETVTHWQPLRHLAFTIRADTASIPPGTLDSHVTIGGPYFDTLSGDYRLEPLPGGRVRLHLSSRHRLSTTFNFYGSLWTDAVMRDVQNNILHVIQNRCESRP